MRRLALLSLFMHAFLALFWYRNISTCSFSIISQSLWKLSCPVKEAWCRFSITGSFPALGMEFLARKNNMEKKHFDVLMTNPVDLTGEIRLAIRSLSPRWTSLLCHSLDPCRDNNNSVRIHARHYDQACMFRNKAFHSLPSLSTTEVHYYAHYRRCDRWWCGSRMQRPNVKY